MRIEHYEVRSVAKSKREKNEELGVEIGTKRELFLVNTKRELEKQNDIYKDSIFLNEKIIETLEPLIEEEKEKFK